MRKLIAQQRAILQKMTILAIPFVAWERWAYLLILLLAIGTRFFALGVRAISHDESLHAYFSYQLYQGHGYSHDPRLHGPLQFFLVALSFLSFGDSDFTARIPAALAGVALVLLPLWFRPWLGRGGAFVTSLGLLISPSLLYYQRYIRNDSLIAFFTALMTLSLFAFIRTRQQRWLYLGAVAVALSLSTKEVALIHGFLGLLFIGLVWLWERLSARQGRWMAYLLSGGLLLLLGLIGWRGMLGQNVSTLLLICGLLLSVLLLARLVDRTSKPIDQTLKFLFASDWLYWPVCLTLLIFMLLYTAFFTNLAGLRSGTIGAVSYWLAQQGVARGSQPEYYYLLLLLLYEFLPFLLGGLGGLIYLWRPVLRFPAESPADAATRNIFAAYLIFWGLGSLTIYSWAGEKMPWLLIHIALPFMFLLGYITQIVIRSQRSAVRDQRLGIQGWKLGGWVYFAVLGVGMVLTVRFAWLANYVNYDYVNEYLVYAHGTPDIKRVLNEIDRVGRETGEGKQLVVAYGGIPWPLEWYMRQYANSTFFGYEPTAALVEAPVIIFAPNSNLSTVTVEDVEPFLNGNYQRFDYRLVWWPLEDYRDLTLARIWHDYIATTPETRRQNWQTLWQIVFYRRHPDQPLETWPHRTRMYFFVRHDLESKD